jgi:GT2 family glycosyltransferase
MTTKKAVGSILLVSYNHFEQTTGPCLASMFKDPELADWEVIVVDNASQPETREALSQAEAQYPALRVIFNDDNRGYPAGANQAMVAARGEVLVLLNNDTLVPSGMLPRLITLLAEHPEWGLLSPVTNSAGNEQAIAIAAEEVTEIIAEGQLWCQHAVGSFVPSKRLDFSCLAVSRWAYERLGALDEGFGRGYFEDFDYCLRAIKAAIPMMIAEEVFIYHEGGGSFKKIPAATKKLIRGNKKRLIRKYAGDVDFKHSRQVNLDVLRHYIDQATGLSENGWNDLQFRFDNRYRQALSSMPRGWLKRWRYKRDLAQVFAAFQAITAGQEEK